MKKLTEENGICLLGGKGKVLEADPEHDLLFLYPGMIGLFGHFKEKAQQENIDEESFNKLLMGLKGIVLFDTLGKSEKNKKEIGNLHTSLKVLETKTIGFYTLSS
jgi:hypothetical protein